MSKERGEVHVFGPPNETGEDRILKFDERCCTDPDRDELVIFHCNCILVDHATNNWVCKDCGKESN